MFEDKFMELLCQLFNDVFSGDFLNVWRASLVTMLYKGKGPVSEPQNYRGIALSAHLFKLYEACLNERLYKWLSRAIKLPLRKASRL